MVNGQRANVIIEHLVYDTLEDKFDLDTSTTGQSKQDLSKARNKLQNHIYDYVLTNSAVECKFVEKLGTSKDVAVYVKLPRGFLIPIPIDDYNPDWIISFKGGSVKHVYFVTETKGLMSSLDLRPIEATRIKCACKFLDTANKMFAPGNAKHDVMNSFSKLTKVVK